MPRVRIGALDLAPDGGPLTSWEPDRWSPRHALAARMKGAGFKNGEIAEALDIHPQRVSMIVNDERAKPFILEAQQKVADGILDLNIRLKHHAEEALNEIVDQMRTAVKDETRQKAAFGILDRAGYTPVQRHVVQPPPPNLPTGLSELVAEAHAEITEVRRSILFRAPPPAELTSGEGRDLTGMDGA